MRVARVPHDSGESVDVNIEPFGPWIEPMLKVGAVDPRGTEPRASWNALAKLAGVAVSTITNGLKGDSRVGSETIQKIAKALKVTPEEVSDWFRRSRRVGLPYIPPPEADELNVRQRKAVDELIRSIVAEQDEGEAGGVVTPIRPPRQPSDQSKTKAARRANRSPASKRSFDEAMGDVGEENQDPGGIE